MFQLYFTSLSFCNPSPEMILWKSNLFPTNANYQVGDPIFSLNFHILFSFIDEKLDGDVRFLMTEPLHIGPTYIIQFDLVMGCRLMYDMTKNNLLYLEYSSDHGLSWSLVQEPCAPPTSCKDFTEGTVYKPTKYTEWTQVTVMLPPATW